ncbi:Predicted DNA binding protein, contains HTH domain [Halorubrum aquaticum]|uniref:Predicted DNA binding protein, contains HTH domain n=1 Tax=Halorubrum aquaticum TaxID=387340 RepID=A0A1I3CPM5_9EURY|nr:bacterio-opsin activator domain-containing protein [Halorubrum aquaticum]SFH76333.1 Predicted DNA binding protein, contains HTH domain [Halorubrum aquaticum]
MATEATFTVPSDQFPLGTLFEPFPEVTVELERIIPAQDVVIPYFWVRGVAVDNIEDTFHDHPGVENIRLVDSVGDQYLLRVEWTLEYDGVLSTLMETGVPLIKAVGTSDQWTFDVRGDERRDIAAFQGRCRELDIPITLTKLQALTPIESKAETALTDTQQEALMLAYERGYFNTPRDVTMADLGQ